MDKSQDEFYQDFFEKKESQKVSLMIMKSL